MADVGEKKGAPDQVEAGAEKKPSSEGKSYTDRLTEASKWGVGALGAVATTAITTLSLDRLGKGNLDTALIAWAYIGLAAFALGVASLIAAVIWHTRSSRVTLGYLLTDGYLAKKIRTFLNENPYLFGGANTLAQFRDELNTLQAKRKGGLHEDDIFRLEEIIAARSAVINTAAKERTRYVSVWATAIMLVAVLLTTFGGATFAIATNRDVVLREDRLAKEEQERAKVPVGEILPKIPSSTALVIPKKRRSSVETFIGASCAQTPVNAILVEVGNPPPDAVPGPVSALNAFHVVTEETDDCTVANLWVPANWLIERLAEPSEEDDLEDRDGEEETPKQHPPVVDEE